MVNWQEVGKMWLQPHPHAVRLLRGLVWGQHYRHSNPQCEGGMSGSFKLREDMHPDRCNGSSDSTQLYTDVIRISMILRCTLVQ